MGDVKETILNHASDAISDFLYYDRKEDDDLKVGDIEQAIIAGDISVDDIINKFRELIESSVESVGK